MIPGMNSRKAQQMMKRMGIPQQEIDATEVIIRTAEKEIVIKDPSVSKVNMKRDIVSRPNWGCDPDKQRENNHTHLFTSPAQHDIARALYIRLPDS